MFPEHNCASFRNILMVVGRIIEQGPVVESIVSLTSSRSQLFKCFKTLLPNTLIFFVEKKIEKLLHCKRFSNY